jgi:hypothetical protein
VTLPIDPNAEVIEVRQPREPELLSAWRLQLAARIVAALDRGSDVAIDCTRSGSLEPAVLGMLLRHTRQARSNGRRVTLLLRRGSAAGYLQTACGCGALDCAEVA